jgi:antitoxin component YwqK of YwqJK toxin-antitoxin module
MILRVSVLKWKRELLLVAAAAALLAAFVLFRPQPPEPTEQIEVPREELSLRDGLLYRENESRPFTGMMLERYADGTLKSRTSVAAGLLEGISEGWHPGGQLQVREHFERGISHGPRTKWYEDGTLMSETMIQEGEHHGMFRRWHENGQLAEAVAMRHGEPDGVSLAYYPSGFLKARAVLENGSLLEQSSWEDGQKHSLEAEPLK